MGFVARLFHPRKDEVRPALEILVFAAAAEQGRVMSRVDILQLSRLDVKAAHPCGDEHLGGIRLTQLPVRGLKHLVDRLALRGDTLDRGARRHHEQRRGNAFSRYIGDQKGDRVAARKEEIVKIAAHLFGGAHLRKEVEFAVSRERREHTRQGARLDGARQRELVVDPLGFRFNIPFQRAHGGVDVL